MDEGRHYSAHTWDPAAVVEVAEEPFPIAEQHDFVHPFAMRPS